MIEEQRFYYSSNQCSLSKKHLKLKIDNLPSLVNFIDLDNNMEVALSINYMRYIYIPIRK